MNLKRIIYLLQIINAFVGMMCEERNAEKGTCTFSYLLPNVLATKWDLGDFNTWLFPTVSILFLKCLKKFKSFVTALTTQCKMKGCPFNRFQQPSSNIPLQIYFI